MLRLFFAALVIVILYFMFREYRKLNKKQELREGLNEKLEHVEDELETVHVESRVLDVEEVVAQKQAKLEERKARLKGVNVKE